MSDTVVKYFDSWVKYFASTIPTDVVFAVTVCFYAIATVALLVYKFISYDSDVYFASRDTINYLNTPSKCRVGSLNYHMRSFPPNIYRAWEKYYLDKNGRPSDYLSLDLAYSLGALEQGLSGSMVIATVFATLVNLMFALSTKLTTVQALYLPVLSAIIGGGCIFTVNMSFLITKRLALKKFAELIKELNFYAANNFAKAPEIPPVSIPNLATSNLAENLSKVLTMEDNDKQSANG